ncbi:antibiotic biosynthesis monooxygenase [Streptomyces sp. NPDC048641]|uniref:antibiotic biosynthesis monooxygenase family protein n=1 Tax=unclassified Streptomyces TaxID=2593676 RepID=UPI00341D4B84
MSDHGVAPVGPEGSPGVAGAVRPVPVFEPPYYAAVFTSVRTPGDNGYGATAERMSELVREIPGFLGEDFAASEGGLRITVAYFRHEEGLKKWAGNGEHREAQRRGRAEWYERYSLHVAKVERSQGFERGE